MKLCGPFCKSKSKVRWNLDRVKQPKGLFVNSLLGRMVDREGKVMS